MTPSSIAFGSLTAGTAGVVDALQIEHGQAEPVPVVNDQTKLPASALPATSFTPLAPPAIVAVYVVDAASVADGVIVTVLVDAL